MSREEFMAQLTRLLADMPESECEEAIRYYKDYFDEAGPENETKVIQELGSPEKVAASIKANLQDSGFTESTNTKTGYTTESGSQTFNEWTQTPACSMTAQKQRSTGKWALLIILLVFASPLILGIGGGVLGGILGLAGAAFGILLACLGTGVGLTVGGMALLVKGFYNMFHLPLMGVTGIGGGLLCIAIGLLFLALFLWFCFQILPRLVRTIVNFVSRILHKRKREAV